MKARLFEVYYSKESLKLEIKDKWFVKEQNKIIPRIKSLFLKNGEKIIIILKWFSKLP